MFDVQEEIIAIRNEQSTLINRIKNLAGMTKPPVVQEIILAQRATEDSRMRLGVALGYHRGTDPFRDRESEIAAEA